MATTIKLTTVNKSSVPVSIEGYTSPTKSTAGEAEIFGAAIVAADGKSFFIVNNENGSADLSVSLTAGDFVGAADTDPVTVAKGSTAVLFADSAYCKTAEGLLSLKLTPPAGTALTACGVKLAAVQLLPVINH